MITPPPVTSTEHTCSTKSPLQTMRKISFENDENRNDTEQAARVDEKEQPGKRIRSEPIQQPSVDEKERPKKRFRSDQTKLWDTRFEELMHYKQQFGDCMVPRTFSESPQLGTWVNTQRKQYRLLKLGKKTQMTKDRLMALESIGFAWSKCEKMDWEDRLVDLLVYKDEHGDCLVPQRYDDNPQLGTWVNNQRTQYKLYKNGNQCSMTAERVAELERMGFVWSAPVHRFPPKSKLEKESE